MPPISISTFNSNTLNSSSYKSSFINPGQAPGANIVFIDQPVADSVLSGTYTVGVRSVELRIQILNYASRKTLREQLMLWFKRGVRGYLVGLFDDGANYQLDCQVESLEQDPDFPLNFVAHLKSGDTTWRAVTADTASWSPSGVSGSQVINVAGTDETRLSVTLTPTSSPTGVYTNQQLVQMINIPGVTLGYKSFCITIDTATLIDGGVMQDDCSDLRIFDNGLEINRWVSGPDSATTKLWFNLYMSAGVDLPLSSGTAQVETATAAGAISGTGNATVTVTAAGMTGSPKAISVAVVSGDTAVKWAKKVRNKLKLDVDVTALFTVSGAGNKIVLVRKAPAANDATLNIALANGTCTGITAAPTSANTTAAVLYSIASSGSIPSLTFVINPTVQAYLAALPAQFILIHGTEWIKCQKNAASILTCSVDVLLRGVMSTTLQAHNGGDSFNYIEHNLMLFYGNDAAPDPTLATGYNNTKPVFDLAGSDLTQITYTTTSLFYDPAYPNRTGAWGLIVGRDGINSKLYYYQGNASSGNPALGINTAAFISGVSWRADNVAMGWILQFGRVRRITCTGRSYRSGTLFPASAKLQCSDNGSVWTDVFSEPSPSSSGAYQAWAAHTNIDIADTSALLRLLLQGVTDSSPNSYQQFEALTLTVYWKTSDVPSITLLGNQSNYHMDITIRNQGAAGVRSVDDSINVLMPMRLNKIMAIDGENFTAQYDQINNHNALKLNDESRTVYLRLLPGNNTVTLTSNVGDMGTVLTALSWYKRRL